METQALGEQPELPPHPRVGPYRLLQQLGEGGMGVVHLALDQSGKAVAIKVLRPHVAADPAARTRLAREVDTLSRIRHPNVAPIVDHDVSGDLPYIVTRYIAGPGLDEVVEGEGPLDGAALVQCGRGLAAALHAIHEAGVIHRDVKPGNILMFGGEPILIDFGIAHVADDVRLTRTGLVMGTPGYLSPEIVEGAEVTESTDWWGWAATLGYAAQGRPPFGRGSMESILTRVVRGEADLAGVDPALTPLLEAALSPGPDDRPTDTEVLRALERYAQGGDVTDVLRVTSPRAVPPTQVPPTQVIAPGSTAVFTPVSAAPRPPALAPGPDPTATTARGLGAGSPAAGPWAGDRASVRSVPGGLPYRIPDDPQGEPWAPEPAAQRIGYAQPASGGSGYGGPGAGGLGYGVPAPGASSGSSQPAAWAPPAPGASELRGPGDPQPAPAPARGPSRFGWRGRAVSAPNPPPATARQPAYPPLPAVPAQVVSSGGDRPGAHLGSPTAWPAAGPGPGASARPYGDQPPPPRPPMAGDPRIGRATRAGVLAGLAGVLVVGAAAFPAAALVAALSWSVLARTADRSVTSLVMRRHNKGVRSSDVARSLLAGPIHLISGLVATIAAAAIPAAVGLAGVFATLLALRLAALPVDVAHSYSIALAAGMALALMMAWWGPGGAGLRRGSRSLARGVAPGPASAQAVGGLLLAAAVGLGVWTAQSVHTPNWAPAQSPPAIITTLTATP